jgi:hypothetical protein
MLSTQFLAQAGHFLLGMVFVFMANSLLGHPWIGAIAAMLYQIPKETLIDPGVEGEPFLWDGALDLGVMILGVLACLGVLWIGRI